MPQHITVLDYNPEWPLKYEQEKEKISAILICAKNGRTSAFTI